MDLEASLVCPHPIEGASRDVILLVPADLDQQLDLAAVTARAEALAPRLGYSLQPLLDVLRPAS